MNDLIYALRMIRKNAGSSVTALFALGLAIGGGTAIFTVVDTLVWKPLPLPGLNRLVMLGANTTFDELSPAEFRAWRDGAKSLDNVSAFDYANLNLSGSGEPERVQGFRVSASLFQALGVAPALGRSFGTDEEQPGNDRVVMLSYKLWQRRYAGDPRIVGGHINVNARDCIVAGVMPEGFEFPLSAELWVPLALTPQESASRTQRSLLGVARLKPGMTVGQARVEMAALEEGFIARNSGMSRSRTASVVPLRERISPMHAERSTVTLLGALFVLLIACVNVANLQLAQATARQRDMAVRAALGARRWRLIRLMLIESLVRAFAAAALGLLLAFRGLDLIRSLIPAEIAVYLPGWNNMAVDTRALAFTILLAIVSGVISGLVPALVSSRAALNESLKEGGRTATGGRARLRSAFVVAEVSLSLVLIAGAGLMVKGFRAVAQVEQGMGPQNVLRMRVSLPASKYGQERDRAAFYGHLLERVEALPQVTSAAAVTNVPYSSSSENGPFQIAGAAPLPPGESRHAQLQSVSPSYFETLHVPFVEGRMFDDHDGASALPVAIISESLARRYFDSRPLGQRIIFARREWAVVGIVADVQHDSYDQAPRPTLYFAYQQMPDADMDVLVRTRGEPLVIVPAVRAQVIGLDPDQPVFGIESMEKLMADEGSGRTVLTSVMGALGMIALALASIGVYAVMAFAVAERTHEIGVRIALGASRAQVMRMVLRRSVVLVAAGIAIDLPAALGFARILSGAIFGVNPADPAVFMEVSLVLTAAAVAATYIPARRAMQVDPVEALRNE